MMSPRHDLPLEVEHNIKWTLTLTLTIRVEIASALYTVNNIIFVGPFKRKCLPGLGFLAETGPGGGGLHFLFKEFF